MPGIRARRLRRGISVQDAAQELGVTRQAWHYWEAGQYIPSAGLLPAMAQVLRCRIEDLYTDEDGAIDVAPEEEEAAATE